MNERRYTLIEVSALRLRCLIGVRPEERRGLSDVVIDLAIEVPPPTGCGTDRLEDIWNYKPPVKAVISYVEPSSHQTVESLAENIAHLLVVGHGAPFVRIRVAKPGALRYADSVAVVIERTTSDFASSPVPLTRQEVSRVAH